LIPRGLSRAILIDFAFLGMNVTTRTKLLIRIPQKKNYLPFIKDSKLNKNSEEFLFSLESLEISSNYL
jgi:hypothetical protein